MDHNLSMHVAQQAQRMSALEDLLRRNENTLGSVLGRMKDVEIALNTMHRALGKVGPDLAATIDEVKGMRRRVDVLDQTYQQKLKDIEGALLTEIRANKPTPLSQDPVFQRLAQETTTQRTDLQETIAQVRRLTDVASADGKAIRAVEQDVRWLAEQMKDQTSIQRDFATQQGRRNEQSAQQTQALTERIQTVDVDLRRVIDAVVKATREETFLRMEQGAKARLALQNDFVSAFGRMREDVVKGFTETASNLKNLDETAHSLETVLRAEVRSRMATHEETTKRVEVVEERLRREALSAAEYLRALDTQMSAALRDVRDVSASECRSQLETVWRSVDDLTDQVRKINSTQASSTAKVEEVTNQRTKMTIEQVSQESRDEMMRVVESRLAVNSAAMEALATKSEVQELQTRLSLKLQEVERHANKTSSTTTNRVTFEAGADGSSTTTSAMRVKKISERVDDAEKQLIVVAEAIRDVHEELVEKLEKLETQSAALDALQKSLQETFERDQVNVAEQTSALRQQIVAVLDELETSGKVTMPPPDAATPAKTGDDGATPTEGTDPERSASPSAAFTARSNDVLLRGIKKDLADLQHTTRRELAELKTQQDQLFDRQVSNTKAQREDCAQLRNDIAAVSTRAQENAEIISQRLHDTTTVTNENFAKVNDELARLGGSPAAVPAAQTPTEGTKPVSAAPVDSKQVQELAGRCDAIERNVKKLSDRVDSTAAKEELDLESIQDLERRVVVLEKGSSAAKTEPPPAARHPTPPPPRESPPPAQGADAKPATPAASSTSRSETPAASKGATGEGEAKPSDPPAAAATDEANPADAPKPTPDPGSAAASPSPTPAPAEAAASDAPAST